MTDLMVAPDALFLDFQTALAGRYSIDRELGRGGMGVVYLAREVHLDRLVAIKLLPPALASRPALRARFLREAQLAAKLSHPNIIPIHAVHEAGAFVYFVMAFIDGETLAQRVQSRGPLSASDGIRLLREVAWALSYAHAQGLVHRDVKPDNILIETATGRTLVADFGIAAAVGVAVEQTRVDAFGNTPSVGRNGVHESSVDTSAASVTGTPEFMSPEQAIGGECDARSDLYSLGATAFYALSGTLPFTGATATEVLARQVSATAPSLGSAGTAVPRKLVQLVDRCLAKDPAQRPSSAQELADLLGVAIEHRRELPAALRAFVKRNGRMDGGGTLLTLGSVVVAAVATAKMVGPLSGLLTFVGGVSLSVVGFAIGSAKRLLDQGFSQADIVPAFRAERESSREERGTQVSNTWRAVERALLAVTRVSAAAGAAVFVVAAVAMRAEDTSKMLSVAALYAALNAIAIVSGGGYLALLQMRRDVDVECWSAVWTGRVGSWAFAVAKRLRGAKPMAPAMTHRATELSLGLAAEQLFESLPKATRESLGDVPDVLHRLQQDAQRLRVRLNRLQDGLQQHGLQQHGLSAIGDDASELHAERDRVSERLRATVGAMETLRLSLLRLHAGSLSLDAFTTHLDLAADVSADVERLIAAQDEVDVLLRVPPSNALISIGGD
jgi:serine/threonine-protein kinase